MPTPEEQFRLLMDDFDKAWAEQQEAWLAVLQKQSAIGAGKATENPSPGEEERLARAIEAMRAVEQRLEQFRTEQGYRR